MGVGYRRARLSTLAGGGAFGSGVGSGAASNFPSAARSGSRRGAWGNRSSSIARRIAAVTAASSSAVRLIVGTGRDSTSGYIYPARRGSTGLDIQRLEGETIEARNRRNVTPAHSHALQSGAWIEREQTSQGAPA